MYDLAELPDEDTQPRTSSGDDSVTDATDTEVEQDTPSDADAPLDEVAIDAPSSGGRSAGGLIAAGGLLVGVAGVGLLQRRRRIEA